MCESFKRPSLPLPTPQKASTSLVPLLKWDTRRLNNINHQWIGLRSVRSRSCPSKLARRHTGLEPDSLRSRRSWDHPAGRNVALTWRSPENLPKTGRWSTGCTKRGRTEQTALAHVLPFCLGQRNHMTIQSHAPTASKIIGFLYDLSQILETTILARGSFGSGCRTLPNIQYSSCHASLVCNCDKWLLLDEIRLPVTWRVYITIIWPSIWALFSTWMRHETQVIWYSWCNATDLTSLQSVSTRDRKPCHIPS